MHNRTVILSLMAALIAIFVAIEARGASPASAGSLDSVTGPVPPSVVVGGNTVITVAFHDDTATSSMAATVGAPNNFVFTAATVVPVCSASTVGLGTGSVTLADVGCDANNVSEPFVWTLTLTCTSANPSATPSTPITVTGAPSAAGQGTVTVMASCTGVNTPPPTQVFECFNAQRGPDAAAVVRLVTENFGGDLVRVRNLVMMCEFGFKVKPAPGTNPGADTTPLPDPAQVRIFACYRLERGDDPNDPFTLTTGNFGTDKVTVRDSNLLCEEGSKTRTRQPTAGGPPVTVTVGSPTGVVWQCYRLADARPNDQRFRLLTNNFGRDDVSIGRGAMMCEEAAKQRIDPATNTVVETGKATGNVVECFAVRSGTDAKAPVTLETKNFGKANTIIRRPLMMCEAAKKVPSFTFSGPENPKPEDLPLGSDE